MELKIDLKQFTPKNIYMRNEQKHYLDPYRQMLVPLSSESLLLYKIECYVHQVMGVPKQMMYVNQSFRKYGVDSSKIIDVVIHDQFEGELKPVAVVECKSPGLALYHTTTTHIENFAKKVGINYLIVTNGNDVDSYISRQDRLSFWKIDNIPNYETICNGHREILAAETEVVKPKSKHPAAKAPSQATKFSSKSTPKEVQSAVMAILKALKDERKKFKPEGFEPVKVVGDCGLRKKLVGFGSEKASNILQRTFLMRDFFGSHQLLSIDLSPDASGAPILSVTLDDVDNRQVVYGLNLSKSLHKSGSSFSLSESLENLLPHETPAFIQGVKQLVIDRAPQLLDGNQVDLGSFHMNSETGIHHDELSESLVNLMTFAILLDEYRMKLKMNAKVGRRNK